MLTEVQLIQIMRNASQRKCHLYLVPLNDAMVTHGIDNLLRTAAFIAQLAHESGEFQFMEEIWGPTAAQKRYEPPSDLAKRLGNTQPGDGKRFKGRGPIQITGRFNYQKYGDLLGLDLISNPAQAATPEVGFATAALFWERNGLNKLADADQFKDITQRINGGQNGAAERERYYERAKLVLASAFPVQAAAPGKKARASAEFPRGFENIRAEEKTLAPKSKVDKAVQPSSIEGRVLNVRPDTLDFRDLMYTPTLVEVPTHVPLYDYFDYGVPVLDQGREGACTGFGLATVANYLLLRRRVIPDAIPVSPRMFYELARRYDEWPGEQYSGSSARGAMKGWHKHGVCEESAYPYKVDDIDAQGLTDARTSNALQRPLGAYFRVNHKDLVAMHTAIAEVGILYATCAVHKGWGDVGADGIITQSSEMTGGHAFAIVAYDDQGFWLQNSWGLNWGNAGCARISYDDWLENGTDIWVARLGAPVNLRKLESIASMHAATSGQSASYSFSDLRPHIVSVGNNGELKAGGNYGSTQAELNRIFEEDIPRVVSGWDKPRILLYTHGGLTSEKAAVQRLAEYRSRLLDGQVYPLAFIWRTDYWTTVTNILQDAVRRRRPEGWLDDAKDFMLDRLDDALEPLARAFTGKAAWDEMKENAKAASAQSGAAVLVAENLKILAKKLKGLEIHLVSHSAGSILQAPLIKLLTDRGLKITTCTLWAPACTVDIFNEFYLPAMEKKNIAKLAAFVLDDTTEQEDNCARIYNKSLLYLVSNAFEGEGRIPFYRQGVPILGMARWHDATLRENFKKAGAELILAPNAEPNGSLSASSAMHHGDFDDDEKTVVATFKRIAAGSATEPVSTARAGANTPVKTKASTARNSNVGKMQAMDMFSRSDASLRNQRQQIDLKTR